MELLWRVERYLKRSGMAATRFRREAVRDPRLVHDMRKGREPRERTARRIDRFLDSHGEGAGR